MRTGARRARKRDGTAKGSRGQLIARKEVLPRSLVPSAPGDARVGPALCVPAVLAELGVEPRRAFRRARVALKLFDHPDNRIALESFCRLLSVCAAMTDCEHFGLLVGERFKLTDLGPIGQLMRNAATVADALRALVQELHLHDRGAVPVLLPIDPSSVLLGYSIYRHDMPSTFELYDVTMAIAYRLLREVCGSSWTPQHVQFAHRRPMKLAPYRRRLGNDLRFDAEVSGVVFASSWLEHPIAGADRALHDLLDQAIRNARASGGMTFAEEVPGVLHQMVLSGTASATAVARLFGIQERRLRKRLSREGTTLRRLVRQTRFELAQQLLQNTGLPIGEIAASLHYADANVFSRAFRSWARASPRQWRIRHGSSVP